MRQFHGDLAGMFIPSGFFVLRTPLLPVARLLAWSASATDPAELRRGLGELIGEPVIAEALAWASADLSAGIEHWHRDPASARGRRAERTLVSYLSRLCERPTPHGLMAGISVGRLGGHTKLTLGGIAADTRHVSPDHALLAALVERMHARPAAATEYCVNPSARWTAGCARFYRPASSGSDEAGFVALTLPSDVATLLGSAGTGADRRDYARRLADLGYGRADSEAAIGMLVEAGLLVPTDGLAVTTPDAVADALRLLRLGGEDDAATALTSLAGACQEFSAVPLGAPEQAVRLMDRAQAMSPRPVHSPVRADLHRAAPALCLATGIVQELTRAALVLATVTQSRTAGWLADFHARFVDRFGADDVPLTVALDPVAGLEFGADADRTPEVTLGGPESQLLTRWWSGVVRDGGEELVLDDSKISQLSDGRNPPLPDSFAIRASVYGDPADPGGHTLHLLSVVGPSGIRTMGRLCLIDLELADLVARHLAAEEALRPDAVFAEICHQPLPELGGVLCRPTFGRYQIRHVGGYTAADRDRVIAVSDLMVRSECGRLRLWSHRLAREVVPRMSSAHRATSGADPVYRFLAALQAAGARDVAAWTWGPLGEAGYLPRVRYGRTILAPQRWRLDEPTVAGLTAARETERMTAFLGLRRRLRMPRHVHLDQGSDKQLFIDTGNPLMLGVLLSRLRGDPTAGITESFLPSLPSPVHDGADGYRNEIIVPVVRRTSQQASGAPLAARRALTVRQDTLQPWLYAKIYCGRADIDQVLIEHVAPFADRALASGLIDGWFFVRYLDPGWHIRLRLHQAGQTWPELLKALAARLDPLRQQGVISDWMLTSYQPETTRYGGPSGLYLAERLFHHDSVFTLAALRAVSAGTVDRFSVALAGVGSLLDALGLGLGAKFALTAQLRTRLDAEDPDDLPQWLYAERRRRGETIRLQCRPDSHRVAVPELLADPGRRRSAALARLAGELRQGIEAGSIGIPLGQLARAYVHMHLNRLLSAGNRTEEILVYDTLYRHYRSCQRRAAAAGLATIPASTALNLGENIVEGLQEEVGRVR